LQRTPASTASLLQAGLTARLCRGVARYSDDIPEDEDTRSSR